MDRRARVLGLLVPMLIASCTDLPSSRPGGLPGDRGGAEVDSGADAADGRATTDADIDVDVPESSLDAAAE